MGKKSIARHGAKPPFRESDFAGRPVHEQVDLSGSLNHLSQQLDATRRLLQEIEGHTPGSREEIGQGQLGRDDVTSVMPDASTGEAQRGG